MNLKKFRFISNCVIGAVIITILAVTLNVTADKYVSSSENSAIYKGTSTDKVSLMINVYWGTEFIDEMLDILKENDVKTTFFIGGCWAAQNIETLKKIILDGHEIGNHGYYHKDHKQISEKRNYEEINITHELVRLNTGVEMNLFAPPSGSFGNDTLRIASELGYKTIMWTRDTIDWRDHDSELIYSRAVKKASGGDLILMHPTAETVKALDGIIKTLKEQGLKVAPVSEVL